ncbi:Phospholipase ABHD3-like 1 [Homarus americanus]|uniref:Phospholipase ABHD3-like 1 n=1 Tax=Homarus americanus TaxID=6706 RepID=A0A8J5MX16_HOMAM|nr:Phospholipase ABHD3-like 1 [Homarus americanus]
MDWYSLYSECPRMVLGLSLSAGLLVYYMLEAVKRPLLACRHSAWRGFLETNLTILKERYWPTPWCYESRCQTILASVLRSRLPDITYKRELLELKDGGQICLDWLETTSEVDQPIIIILPGLTGSSQSEYVKSFTARTYCAANSDDLEEAIEHIRAKFPKAPLMATGISLGGMILGNYLVTRGEQAAQHLVAAMVLSIPWNVFVGTESLEKPLWNLLLNRHLANCLCESIRSMRKQLEGDYKWDLDHVMEVLYGIPVEAANKSSHVAIIVTARGGHIGFMEGVFPTNTYYSDRIYKQLVNGIFSNLDKIKEVKREADEHAQLIAADSTNGSVS